MATSLDKTKKRGFQCVAFGCNNRSRQSSIPFHRFPLDRERRQRWITAVKRDNWTPSEHSRLCGAHFVSGKFCTVDVFM